MECFVEEFAIKDDNQPFFFKGILLGYVYSYHVSSNHDEYVRLLRLDDGETKVIIKVRPSSSSPVLMQLEFIAESSLDSREFRFLLKQIEWELGLDENTNWFHRKYSSFFPNLPMGYRVTKTPLEEILLTSLLSQNASMNMYALQMTMLARRLGSSMRWERKKYYFLPTWEEISRIDEQSLKECKLGYRTKYIPHLVSFVSSLNEQGLLDHWRTLTTEEIISELVSVKGIGPYSAAVIALYGLGREDAFFSDVYIKKLLSRIFRQQDIENPSISSMKAWRTYLNETWDESAGWMVDFLTANDMIQLPSEKNPHFLLHQLLSMEQ